MAQLKTKNLEKCVSILKQYLDDPQSLGKDKAILALEQLQRITAGIESGGSHCIDNPRADRAQSTSIGCVETPRIDGSPGASYLSCVYELRIVG